MLIEKIENRDYLFLEKSGIRIGGGYIGKDGSDLYFELSESEQIFGFYEELDCTIDSIPNDISIGICAFEENEEYKFAEIFKLFEIKKKENELSVLISSCGDDLHYIDYKDYVYYRAMILEAQTLTLSPIIEYEEKGNYDTSILSLIFKFSNKEKLINEVLEELKPILENLKKVVDLQVNNFKWNVEYEKNEMLFSQELLQPLFLKMGFDKVIYNHGN